MCVIIALALRSFRNICGVRAINAYIHEKYTNNIGERKESVFLAWKKHVKNSAFPIIKKSMSYIKEKRLLVCHFRIPSGGRRRKRRLLSDVPSRFTYFIAESEDSFFKKIII